MSVAMADILPGIHYGFRGQKPGTIRILSSDMIRPHASSEAMKLGFGSGYSVQILSKMARTWGELSER
jgi:hypothetical protein